MSFRTGAIVVLGCRTRPSGRLPGAAERRVQRAARAWHDGIAPLIVTSGGRRWRGIPEADTMARALVGLGVPESAIVRECVSLSTRENARWVRRMLTNRDVSSVALVTCDWHMARARAAFERESMSVVPLAAIAPRVGLLARSVRQCRELAGVLIDRTLASLGGTPS